ncbi:MAG: PD-(D/E)XK nuclease family protein, partial [Fusobacteriaceae bacterium]
PDVLSLIKRMNENGIPTYSPRSGNFFKKEEIKTVLGIALSLYKEYTRNNIYNTRDYSNFETYTYYKECINLLKNGSDCIFKDMIPSLKDMNFNCDTKFLDILYKFFSFEYFKNIFSKSNLEDKAYEIIENNLSIISNIIFKYEEKNGSIFKADFFDFYLPFLKECGINEYENEREVSIKNHISFLTFHQSKGLEFPIVLVGSLDKEPTKSSNDFNKILRETVFNISTIQFEEEEQEDFYRVFYTAFSRAKNYLFLTCKDNREIQTKGKKNLSPSNFFSELVDSLVDYESIFSLQDDYSKFLKVENSKNKIFKKKYSFTSDIALYSECPVKYRFLRYSNFPKSQTSKEYLGILVHNTVHNIHQKVLEKEIITETEVKLLLNSNYKQLRSKMNFTLDSDQKKTAYNSVINYLALESYSLMDIEKSEIDLSILRDHYVLNGVLDLIKKKGDEYSVIDFKTSSVKPESVPENYKKQLYIYGYLAESSGYPVNNLELYYTSVEKNPKTSFNYEKKELNLVLKEADEVVEKIMNKEFFEFRISNSCNYCSFIHYCNKQTKP